jgi:hypothetical protein
MHFVYAFFFENGYSIHVKVGESTKPYDRLKDITCGSPFHVAQAVFCHAGGKQVARKFEALVKRSLTEFRTRGEWYAFRKEDAGTFRACMAVAFAKATGRDLKWTKIDIDAFRTDLAKEGFQYVAR